MLSTQEAVGIALALAGSTDDSLGDLIPQGVWDRLHGYGYLMVSTDITGEAVTTTTFSGRDALRIALSEERP